MTPNSTPETPPKNKGGRPRKENSHLKLKSKNWRIVIPHLNQYKDASPEALQQLKFQTLQRILSKEKKYNLQHHCIALERHQNGIPHLDILLIYPKSVPHTLTHFDYILKHGDITTYRQLNQAILDYGKKEDPSPLSNLPENSSQIINIQLLQKDSYSYLYDRMKQDPLHFNLQQYVQKHQLSKHVSNYSSIKTKLKDMQMAAANLKLKTKPGFKFISRHLIQSILTLEELKVYDSWKGYQTIVDHLNIMITEKGCRQLKTLNLLITGPPSIGKTSLFTNPNHKPDKRCVQDFCSVYPMGMAHWFPRYQSGVYHMILWNEAKLTSYNYDTILKLLEGSYMDLPNKGSVSRKVDNPLVVMTSNLTLEQMIQQKFHYSKDYISMARSNLAVRVQNVVVPKGHNLFLLQKLLIPISGIIN